MTARTLPIYELESRLVATLRAGNRLILQAPTGSGKSTQVPQMLLEHGFADNGEIVVLQPRRLATRMLAARVAQERSGRLGDEVGYQIRLDRVCSAKTKIRFVTEGVLLRQMLSDPRLRGISAIIFDEFHERHLYGDITLSLALDLQESRPDLKIIVMSATLDTAILERYLAPCEVLTSAGRMHPVAIEYLERSLRADDPVWDAAAAEFERLAARHEGDALIFMPGSYEIQRTLTAIRHTRAGADCIVLPLHGELPPADQDAAVARYDRRKVIVSTNVAETSLTIDGIRMVIDSGLARIARFDPYRGINTLLVERISRASSDQRAGRAGRTAPGVCARLWTEREHGERAPQELPEVRRLDLAEVILTLKASGVHDVHGFRWLEPPEARSLERALVLLTDLGALAADGGITPLGQRMLAFPVHPRYARMLLAAHDYGCVPDVALIAALAQGRPLLRKVEDKRMEELRDQTFGSDLTSDFSAMLKAHYVAVKSGYQAQQCRPLGISIPAARDATSLRDQFLRIARDEKLDTADTSDPSSTEAVARCILAGFPDHVAMRLDKGTLRCGIVHGRRGVLARESMVQKSTLLVAAEVREIGDSSERNTLLTQATAIEEDWLRELFPTAFKDEVGAAIDSLQKRVVARRRTCFHDLVLREKASDHVPANDAAALLAKEVQEGRCPLPMWDENVEQWIIRLNALAKWFPEFELPPITTGDRLLLLEQICHGASSFREVKEKHVWPTVRSWLSQMQTQLLNQHAPERMELPNGRCFRIEYSETAAPVLAARIQDLYGVEGDLRIAGGRIPLVIHVLGPNRRPLQITQNLSTFWRESYPKLKLELQRKYPKHEWR